MQLSGLLFSFPFCHSPGSFSFWMKARTRSGEGNSYSDSLFPLTGRVPAFIFRYSGKDPPRWGPRDLDEPWSLQDEWTGIPSLMSADKF